MHGHIATIACTVSSFLLFFFHNFIKYFVFCHYFFVLFRDFLSNAQQNLLKVARLNWQALSSCQSTPRKPLTACHEQYPLQNSMVWKVQPSKASSCHSWGLIDEVIRVSRSPQHVPHLPYVWDLLVVQHRYRHKGLPILLGDIALLNVCMESAAL